MAGETPMDTICPAAPAAEAAGFDTFWLSQPKSGSTLQLLQVLADQAAQIRLGVGAIPFTKQSPEKIFAELNQRSLPPERIRLGIGSGTGRGSLDRLRSGVAKLRDLTEAEIVVAPLGPKMCELAGEIADSVLLNWITPKHAATSMEWIAAGAERADRTPPLVITYVRCAIGQESLERLETECGRYSSFPHYAAHFDRQGVGAIETTLHSESASEIEAGLEELESIVDEVVVRAITPRDSIEEVLRLIDVTAPMGISD